LLRANFLMELEKENAELATNRTIREALQAAGPSLIAYFREGLRDPDPVLRERILSTLRQWKDATAPALVSPDDPSVAEAVAVWRREEGAPSSFLTAAGMPPSPPQLLPEFPRLGGNAPVSGNSAPILIEPDPATGELFFYV
jgi:hypothetical protein